MLVTLRNDFHDTVCRIRVSMSDNNGGELSQYQIRRVQTALCGIKGCTCGGVLGQRGSQEVIIDSNGFDRVVLYQR